MKPPLIYAQLFWELTQLEAKPIGLPQVKAQASTSRTDLLLLNKHLTNFLNNLKKKLPLYI